MPFTLELLNVRLKMRGLKINYKPVPVGTETFDEKLEAFSAHSSCSQRSFIEIENRKVKAHVLAGHF